MFLLVAVAALVLLWRHSNRVTPQPGAFPGSGSNPVQNQLDNISEAIAQYEGFYKPGSLAQRTNNPGDIGTYGGNVNGYSDVGDGWGALNNWITSHASANPSWDFYDMMHYYLTGDTMGTPGPNQNPDAYAEYVASYLGVDPATPVSQVLGG